MTGKLLCSKMNAIGRGGLRCYEFVLRLVVVRLPHVGFEVVFPQYGTVNSYRRTLTAGGATVIALVEIHRVIGTLCQSSDLMLQASKAIPIEAQ